MPLKQLQDGTYVEEGSDTCEKVSAPGHQVKHAYRFRNYCGAYVCENCDSHRGLARCYCGWGCIGNFQENFDEPIDPDYGPMEERW